MNTVNIKLYNILKNNFHLSDEKASEFAMVINEVASENTLLQNSKAI